MSSNSRFVNMSSVDLDKLDSEKDSKSTKRTVNRAVSVGNQLICSLSFESILFGIIKQISNGSEGDGTYYQPSKCNINLG